MACMAGMQATMVNRLDSVAHHHNPGVLSSEGCQHTDCNQADTKPTCRILRRCKLNE